MTTRALADRLKAFGIVPKPNDRATARGYHRDRFADAWTRYPPIKPSNRQEPNGIGPAPPFLSCQLPQTINGSRMPVSPTQTGLFDALTLGSPSTQSSGEAQQPQKQPTREVFEL
jgi:hypothetical protein